MARQFTTNSGRVRKPRNIVGFRGTPRYVAKQVEEISFSRMNVTVIHRFIYKRNKVLVEISCHLYTHWYLKRTLSINRIRMLRSNCTLELFHGQRLLLLNTKSWRRKRKVSHLKNYARRWLNHCWIWLRFDFRTRKNFIYLQYQSIWNLDYDDFPDYEYLIEKAKQCLWPGFDPNELFDWEYRE